MTIAATLRSTLDRLMGGRGEHSITVPVMDGPLRPNDYLERVPSLGTIDGLDNLVAVDGRVLASAGSRVIEIGADGRAATVAEEPGTVTCLAAAPGGALAMGIDGQGIVIRGGRHDGRSIGQGAAATLNCLTAALFLDDDTLIVTNGSSDHPAGRWAHDLLDRGRSGTVTRIDLATSKATGLASGLRYPSGLVMAADGRLIVSEAWQHRLVALRADAAGPPSPVLVDLPAYPGRLCRAATGGYWLSLFAVRSQLQEFVLREDRYRRTMMAEIDPEYWVAPALSSGRSFKEPLQAGGVIRLGIHKPWAPTRSYGLVARLDEAFQPVWSAHSRANGSRHGITSVVESEGSLLAAAKGSGDLLRLRHVTLPEPRDLSIASEHAT